MKAPPRGSGPDREALCLSYPRPRRAPPRPGRPARQRPSCLYRTRTRRGPPGEGGRQGRGLTLERGPSARAEARCASRGGQSPSFEPPSPSPDGCDGSSGGAAPSVRRAAPQNRERSPPQAELLPKTGRRPLPRRTFSLKQETSPPGRGAAGLAGRAEELASCRPALPQDGPRAQRASVEPEVADPERALVAVPPGQRRRRPSSAASSDA